MSVYLGTGGEVELLREFQGNVGFNGQIRPSDVNVNRKRLSFDFTPGTLLTGDQLELKTTDGLALSCFDNYFKPGRKTFIHVDELGGLRFYNTFAGAINGSFSDAISLAVPGGTLSVVARVRNDNYRVLAQVRGFELNTQRETVDTTALSEEFRSRLSTLMSGSGSMTCLWEYTGSASKELPQYLLNLVLRTEVGSAFQAKFYLKDAEGTTGKANDRIWYQVEAVITACAVQFLPSDAVEFTADFVTTGKISLKTAILQSSYVLQEDSDKLILDQALGQDPDAAKLLLESSET